mmetsp:Transcript_19901/g.50334  ORF Transcript_19901/g.50334 Transcript_19901/m.50334 type:complete len:406 (-) Transcript_19901:403-1620(-)
MGAPRHAGSAPRSGERGAAAWPPRAANHRRLARQPQADRDRAGGGGGAAQGGRHHPAGGLRRLCDQVRDRARLVPARHRAPLQAGGGDAAPHALRAHGRHVPRARHAAGPQALPAADQRDHSVHDRRRLHALRPEQAGVRAPPRRVLRQRRLRHRREQLPLVPRVRHDGVRARGAGGRLRTHRLLSTGGQRAGRGGQVPRAQRARAGAGRRLDRQLLHAAEARLRRGRRASLRALGRRAPLAGRHARAQARHLQRDQGAGAARGRHRGARGGGHPGPAAQADDGRGRHHREQRARHAHRRPEALAAADARAHRRHHPSRRRRQAAAAHRQGGQALQGQLLPRRRWRRGGRRRRRGGRAQRRRASGPDPRRAHHAHRPVLGHAAARGVGPRRPVGARRHRGDARPA